MLVFVPSTSNQCDSQSINNTIKHRINAIFSGNIEHVYEMAISSTCHSQNIAPTSLGHNRTAQKATDSDQFRTAVQRATTTTSVTSIDTSKIALVNILYTPCPRPKPPSPTTASPDLRPPLRHLHNDTTCQPPQRGRSQRGLH